MKRTHPEHIATIVEKLLAKEGVTDLFNEQRLCYLWPEIVGLGVNRLTTRRFVDRGVLHVYLTSAVLKNELTFQRQSLIEALNRAVGTPVIHDIHFH